MTLTFMAVHAHPDDEASSSGGVFRLYYEQGLRTVLVTCTNGECGDDPDGRKPDHDDHDGEAVAKLRAVELARACEILGISRHEMLGYRDSGMMGWKDNDDPRSFWRANVEEAAQRLARIMQEERPQVVMTYDANGFYGHPDHIQAHRITMRAIELLNYEPTVYFNTIPHSIMAMMRARWEEEERQKRAADAEKGIVRDDDVTESVVMGTPDELVDAAVDVSTVNGFKFDALAAHASQIGESSFWMEMGRERFQEVMTLEWFVRATNPLALDGPVTDLFAGYRTSN